MIAHRLQTIKSAQNLLYIENPKSVLAAEKGTNEYDQLIDRLQKTNYAHQVVNENDEDENEVSENDEENEVAMSQQSHYSQNSMQMDKEGRRESRIIEKEI